MRDLKIFAFLLVGVMAITTASNVGCGMLKQTGRTINDAASILCTLFAVEAAETDPEMLGGMNAADYCAIHDNLQPFIDEALSAKQAAGRISLSRPTNADAGL